MNQGNIILGTNGNAGGGGQAALSSEGTGVPVFDAPAAIRSIEEISGLQVEANQPSVGTIGLRNRLNYFFVDQYGAVGDGVTDDTAAIQAAYTAAGADGKPGAVVFFPSGTYLVSGTITFPAKSIKTLGSGKGNLGNATYIVQSADVNLFDMPLGTAGSSFYDINLTCSVPAPLVSTAIFFEDRNLRMLNVLIVGFFDQLVMTLNTGSVIDSCGFVDAVNHMIDLSNSASPDQGDTTIISCGFDSDSVQTAAAIFQTGSGGTKIIGCKCVGSARFQNCFQAEFPAGQATSDMIIMGCSIEQFTGYGISVHSGSSFENVSIIGGNISSFHVSPTSVGIRLVADNPGQLQGIVIQGVSIRQNFVGIGIDNGGTAAEPIILTGNVLSFNGTDVLIGGTSVVLNSLDVQSAIAPALSVVAPITHVYGGADGNVLGEPDGWFVGTVQLPTGPVSAKIPYWVT